jgi:hypothetical protein
MLTRSSNSAGQSRHQRVSSDRVIDMEGKVLIMRMCCWESQFRYVFNLFNSKLSAKWHYTGRIGRIVLRNALLHGDIDVVAVNECVYSIYHFRNTY